MVTTGTGVLVYGGYHQSSKNIAEFICYLGIAILASRLKVNLPGITGTLSVNFLFILIGVLELSFTETLILGAVSMLAQCLYPERPKAIQVTFNVCAGAVSTALAYIVFHHPLAKLFVDSRPILLGICRHGLLHCKCGLDCRGDFADRAPATDAYSGRIVISGPSPITWWEPESRARLRG